MADDEEDELVLDADESDEVGYAWSKDHVFYDMVQFAATVTQAAADYMDAMKFRMAADNNFHVGQDVMQQQAAKEIESLTVESTDKEQ